MGTTQLVAGDNFNKTWQFLQSDGVTPINLTGCSAVFVMAAVSGGTPVQVATTDSTPVLNITSPATGTVILLLPPSTTLGLVPNLYVTAIKIAFTDGSKFTYDQDSVLVTKALISG